MPLLTTYKRLLNQKSDWPIFSYLLIIFVLRQICLWLNNLKDIKLILFQKH